MGDWTTKLKDICEYNPNTNNKPNTGMNTNTNINTNTNKSVQIYIEGPYGTPSIDINPNSDGNTVEYEAFLMISGGIGITPAQSLYNHLMYEVESGKRPNLKKCMFVWSVKDRVCCYIQSGY